MPTLKSKEIQKAPVNIQKATVQSRDAMGKSGTELEEAKKVSGKSLIGAVIEGARNEAKSKPLGNPKDAKTGLGKVARAVGNTAIKAVTVPMSTASAAIGAAVSPAVKGTNTQASRRGGDIYKSSSKEMGASKSAQSDVGNKTGGFNYKLANK
jgi:hypothetical protein